MVNILKWLNGTNDVEINIPPEFRIPINVDLTFEGLHLFRNSKNFF